MDKPEGSYAQVRLFGRKQEDEKIQQIVYVKYKIEEFIYLVDVMNSVYDKVITNQPICKVFFKKNRLFTLYHYFSIWIKMCWNIGDKRNLFLKLKSKLGLYRVVFTTPKICPEKLTLTVV